MRKLLGGLTLGLGLLAGNAQADVARLYYGIGLSDATVELDGAGDDEKSLGSVNATLGVQLLEFVGLELQIGAGSDQPDSLLSEPMVQYQAAMLKLGYRWDRVALYALGGQARFDIDDELGESDGDSGTAIGGGINLFGNEKTALNLHVLRIDDGAFTTATIGFQHYFGGFR